MSKRIKKDKEEVEEFDSLEPKRSKKVQKKTLEEEALDGIVSVLFFVVAVYLILSAIDKGGRAGEYIYTIGKHLFGIGYFAIPLILCFLSVTFLSNREQRLNWIQVVSIVVLVASVLSILSLGSAELGGLVGIWFGYPFVALVDVYAAGMFLTAIALCMVFVVFNTGFKRSYFEKVADLMRRKPEDAATTDGVSDAVLQASLKRLEETGDDADVRGLSKEDEEAIERGKEQLRQLQGKTAGDEKAELEEGAEEVGVARTGFHAAFSMLGKEFTPPPLSILETDKGKPGVGDIKANANIIKRTLQNFGINVEMDEISIGPSVTRYALKPAEGVKLSRIIGLQNNLSLALAAHPIRIEAPIPGKSLVGIEIPNTIKTTVGLGTLLAATEFKNSDKPLLIALGKDISGKAHFGNLAKMPHVLIAGTTGSGKSVSIHTLITSLLYRNSPENLRFIMIDPKRVELTQYNGIPHLLTPVITDAKKAILSLKWAAKEMDRRYNILEASKVRDISSYHQNILAPALKKAAEKKERGELSEDDAKEMPETMPYIVIMIDELADIMQTYPRELEASIVRLAQMSRAVGIHLLLATQRPSVNVITGLIKANVPSRIAFAVASQIDSRTILDTAGAEKLLGAGDMLCQTNEMANPVRLQGAYITETETKKVVKYLIDTYQGLPEEISLAAEGGAGAPRDPIFSSGMDGDSDVEAPDDDLYEEARELVIKAGKASTSYIQRKLSIGYARAARLMDMLEDHGVIGPANGAKPRDVIGYNGDPTPPQE